MNERAGESSNKTGRAAFEKLPIDLASYFSGVPSQVQVHLEIINNSRQVQKLSIIQRYLNIEDRMPAVELGSLDGSLE